MLGFRFSKFDASTYVIQYQNGQIRREGRGLSFLYYVPNSTLVAIPMGSSDAPFMFRETTADYQSVSIQGQVTYKIENPLQLADLLDFTVDGSGKYVSDDHEKLSQRLVNAAQTTIASVIETLSLREAIRSSKTVEKKIMEGLLNEPAINMLGILPLSAHVLGIKPIPEMARALEAKTREELQQEADQAVYDRRKFAVEQERTIKETELNTQIAVEEKQKQITEKKMETGIAKAENDRRLREMKVEADFSIEKERQKISVSRATNDHKIREMKIEADKSIEEQRQAYIDIYTANKQKEAEIELYRFEKMMEQYKTLDWKLLMALNGKMTKEQQTLLGMSEVVKNIGNIGTLNITPDLLETLKETFTKTRS